LKEEKKYNPREAINDKVYSLQKKINRPLFAQQQDQHTRKTGPKMEKTKNIRPIPEKEHSVNPEQRNQHQHEEKKDGFGHLKC
jgi:hypothetical protein